RRPADNFKAMLSKVDGFAEKAQKKDASSWSEKLRLAKFQSSEGVSEQGSNSSIFVDLFLLMLALGLLLYLTFRSVQAPVLAPVEKPADLSVFTDELMDLTGIGQEGGELDASVLATLINTGNLKQHVQIEDSEPYLSLQLSSRVLFNAGSYDLARSGASILDSLLPELRKQAKPIVIEVHTNGYASLYGEITSEQELSERRAETLMDFFISEGVAEARISAKGYGDSRPARKEDSAQAQELNRRVLLKLEK
ncbi:hypothetical protein A3766_24500, partial [Oleiphilus sp. HI0132]